MNKKRISILAGALTVIGIAIIFAVAISSGIKDDITYAARPDVITDTDYLTVSGSNLVNRKGEAVILRGVNLGGWMLQEGWMCPVSGADGEWGNLDTIEAFRANGFSDEQIQQLFDTYQDNWITESDLDIIAATGANCIRVPFWYRNFMINEAGDWIDDDFDNNPGFKRLDWIIGQAGARGMYVILDLHGAPGGQSMNHSTGTVGRNNLYTSEECRAAMKKLWVAIAERYKNNPAVAAYDIMNEPQNNDGFEANEHYVSPWDSAAWGQTNDVYREMIAAVREIDAERVISVEGIWRIGNLPDPEDEGWTNMLYQVHLYDDTKQFKSLARKVKSYGKRHGVATLVGEFSNMDGIEICEEYGISWTSWTYKGGKGASGSWFWYYGSPEPVIPTEDDFDTALEKWGEALRTENGFTRADGVADRITSAISSEENQ